MNNIIKVASRITEEKLMEIYNENKMEFCMIYKVILEYLPEKRNRLLDSLYEGVKKFRYIERKLFFEDLGL